VLGIWNLEFFDKIVPREGTDCVKFDLREVIFGKRDVIPMWVADMDFAVPACVQEAVSKRAAHPIYGYSVIPDSYYDSIISWQKNRYNWQINKNQILFGPGVVTGLNIIVQALTEPGGNIIVQPPVYFPFFSSVENNGRKLVLNRLIEKDGIYSIDFDDLERKMKEGARMMILCSPHNRRRSSIPRRRALVVGTYGIPEYQRGFHQRIPGIKPALHHHESG
jgi:cysteine-S-conjugate beta-lyase